MVDILIKNVRVRRKIRVYATYIDKRHHGISTDMLEIKWGIELDKKSCTLQSKNQDNVILSLKPLTV